MSFFFLWKFLIIWIQQLIKQWAKPATRSLISVILLDLKRNHADLVVENTLLRQVKRPQLTNRDRFLLILFARCNRFWKQAFHIVQPHTPPLAS